MLDLLLDAGRSDWRQVEPAVLTPANLLGIEVNPQPAALADLVLCFTKAPRCAKKPPSPRPLIRVQPRLTVDFLQAGAHGRAESGR